MLSPGARIDHLNAEQWRRLTGLVYPQENGRKLFLLHEAGVPVRLYDTVAGDLAVPKGRIKDFQASADALRLQNAPVEEVWVLDPEAFAKKMSEIQAQTAFGTELDVYALFDFDERMKTSGYAVSPRRDLLWRGIPLRRVQRFVEKMLPDSCSYVLGVFDGDLLWASLIVGFEGRKIVSVTTTDALPAEDVKDVVGRDQHPFLLSVVANTFGRPAFGWFVEKAVFEAYMKAKDIDDKDEIFQRAIMENQATFDFSILVDRGITAFSPINPGEAAVQGADREANPRTRTPVADGEPGPSAY